MNPPKRNMNKFQTKYYTEKILKAVRERRNVLYGGKKDTDDKFLVRNSASEKIMEKYIFKVLILKNKFST